MTKFLESQKIVSEEELEQTYPERSAIKATNYYVFEGKVEKYMNAKENVEKTYTRTTRVDKTEKVCDIVSRLISDGDSYLHHRSHVDNVASVLHTIRQNFDGKYIEMDFLL